MATVHAIEIANRNGGPTGMRGNVLGTVKDDHCRGHRGKPGFSGISCTFEEYGEF